MKLESVGILIAMRPFGERDAIAHIFTRDFGVLLGMMRGAQVAKRNKPLTGQVGAVSWNARLDSQLGVFHWEPERNLAAPLMSAPAALGLMNSAFALLAALLPEREKYEALWGQTETMLHGLSSPPVEGCGCAVSRAAGWFSQDRDSQKYYSLPYNSSLTECAKELRKAGSLPEALFWKEIKNKKLEGLDFDRQKIIGNYIVDFFCAELGLVVEIDDKASHDWKREYDENRDKYLENLGLKVIHLTAVEVLRNPGNAACGLEIKIQSWLNHPAARETAQPHPSTGGELGLRSSKDLYLSWEIDLLKELGYALDLTRCSNCGRAENLAHLSPRTARAVCSECAAPYLDKLFELPVDLNITKKFLERIAAEQGGEGLPHARRLLTS